MELDRRDLEDHRRALERFNGVQPPGNGKPLPLYMRPPPHGAQQYRKIARQRRWAEIEDRVTPHG